MYCPYMGANFSRLEKNYGNLLIDKGINIMNVGEKGWVILDANSASTGSDEKRIIYKINVK